MIVYDLSCPYSHQFEGWYDSSESFEKLQSLGLLACPICQSQEINRIPSAPFIGSSITKNTDSPAVKETPGQHTTTNNIAVQGDLEQLRQQILRLINLSSEDVGSQFTEIAKKIHYQEIPQKNIRGTASLDELQELYEEGIEVMLIGNPGDSEVKH
ncbi:MAG: hypothetical protein B7Z60_02450 [Ferrovum sp. 37-45-19]|jgi:hypothetical protein|uniref:DUF1178 family protein n=1 Tax=Ferrovum sp. JA12 TaxID=1356299 RepID=UPI0007037305|nr:DUF1178 family protein [Ferrovum sp. JA12]OYV80325.1 MAG: hypothetical protein B7Z65_01955 [Ferrovum sp. 21-44-67]OYV95070.1 MAG: hypothetical protein B7Z60_02450 [Ferrovum sp. 37-45-19]OZB31794.1 MAG: hypothetical protein B7X47_08335 [Ferrovum sp. 34-44-207]HQT80869.1 DUF1178 family protein [Ferrovaceae bacterium]KRH78711.1 hypothetical protein FERRO_17040 [Ferrovum sp. JA12]